MTNEVDEMSAASQIAILQSEIDRLRDAIRRLAEQDATLSVQGGSVTVTADATLTDEEREVLESLVFVARLYAPERTAGVIQRLLERLGKAKE